MKVSQEAKNIDTNMMYYSQMVERIDELHKDATGGVVNEWMYGHSIEFRETLDFEQDPVIFSLLLVGKIIDYSKRVGYYTPEYRFFEKQIGKVIEIYFAVKDSNTEHYSSKVTK